MTMTKLRRLRRMILAFAVVGGTWFHISSSSRLMIVENIRVEDAIKKKHKRWAVLMVGSARTYTFSRLSFIKNVVNQTDPPMDVFTSTEYIYDSSPCQIEKHSLDLLEKDSTAMRFHEIHKVNDTLARSYKMEEKATLDRFVFEQPALLQLMTDYSKLYNITYDYIFFTRPDLYYTVPFNIQGIERAIEGNKSSIIFSPKCCRFFGWCDKLGAGSYQIYSKMILSSRDWWSKTCIDGPIHSLRQAQIGPHQKTSMLPANDCQYEPAFQNRAENVNITNFDLTPVEDYGFITLRYSHVATACGRNKLEGSWVDWECNGRMISDLETTSDSCRLFNNSTSCDKCYHRVC